MNIDLSVLDDGVTIHATIVDHVAQCINPNCPLCEKIERYIQAIKEFKELIDNVLNGVR